jgi:hypothetical protein
VSVQFVLSNKQKENESIENVIINIVKEQKPETISQLLIFVQKTTNLSEKEILSLVNRLEAEGRIFFNTKQELGYVTFGTYFFSSGPVWYWTIMAVAIVAALTIFTIPKDWLPLAYIRNVLGVIFVLFLPGYAFIKTFFPTKVPINTFSDSLNTIERVALSIGMSIALTIIVSLILFYTPIGIDIIPITLSLFVLTMVSATIAVAREYQTKSLVIQNLLR